jgi:hypothetical protein
MPEQLLQGESLILESQLSQYETKEVAVIIVAALAFVLALGGIVVAAIVICGWKGTESINTDWLHGKVSFVCRK